MFSTPLLTKKKSKFQRHFNCLQIFKYLQTIEMWLKCGFFFASNGVENIVGEEKYGCLPDFSPSYLPHNVFKDYITQGSFKKFVSHCIMFKIVFNIIAVISRRPVHQPILFLESFTNSRHNIFTSHWLVSHKTNVEQEWQIASTHACRTPSCNGEIHA